MRGYDDANVHADLASLMLSGRVRGPGQVDRFQLGEEIEIFVHLKNGTPLIHTLSHKIVSAVPTYHCGRSSFILAASFLCCTSFSTIRKKADPDPVIIAFLQREDR